MTYRAQHRAAPASLPPQRQPYMEPWPPYAGQPQPPAKPRKSRNHIMLRVALLAFIAQFPLWFLVFIPPFGPVAVWGAVPASAVVALGCLYGVGYGVYKLARWAVGIDRR